MDDINLTEINFKDPLFLQRGLTEHNVLEYFSLSPFYDKSCINEQINMQARFNHLEAHLIDRT